MPTAIPEAERPDELPVKTIQTTINSKVTLRVSVRTARHRTLSLVRMRAQHETCLYSPTNNTR